MERKTHIDALGASTLIVFSAMMGLNQALIKVVNSGFSPVFQAGLRSLIAFLPVLLYGILARKKLSVSDGSLLPGIVTGTFFSVEFILLFTALEYTTVSRASVLFYTMPFWVALGAHFLIPGERLSVLRVSGLALAVGGVVVALADRGGAAGEYALLGDLMCLAAAAFWAGIALVARVTPLSRSSPTMQLLYQLTVSAVVLMAVAPLFGSMVREVTPGIVGILLFQSIVVVAIGFTVWFWILSVYPASDMASFGFLSPIFGVLFGWLIFDERISASIVIALVMVGSGIYLVNRRRRPGR